ncbi:hypothetical protein ACIBJF_50590 [Streptomyces sp. NPDC050743]|uniref:hypothetical protein n=1 Tax=Streptomyces sp. NPDC050743 TaxID=3365634 RepID=UPI00379FB71F
MPGAGQQFGTLDHGPGQSVLPGGPFCGTFESGPAGVRIERRVEAGDQLGEFLDGIAVGVVQVSDEEIEGALALMDTLTVDRLEGPDFQDRYTEAIAQIIEAKREERPLPEAPEPEQPAQVLDLMAALQESVSKVKAARGEADVHELPKPKKAAAKKQPAKKAAAKKTTAKKTTGRRPRSA